MNFRRSLAATCPLPNYNPALRLAPPGEMRVLYHFLATAALHWNLSLTGFTPFLARHDKEACRSRFQCRTADTKQGNGRCGETLITVQICRLANLDGNKRFTCSQPSSWRIIGSAWKNRLSKRILASLEFSVGICSAMAASPSAAQNTLMKST